MWLASNLEGVIIVLALLVEFQSCLLHTTFFSLRSILSGPRTTSIYTGWPIYTPKDLPPSNHKTIQPYPSLPPPPVSRSIDLTIKLPEPIPSLGPLIHKHTRTTATDREAPPPILTNCNLCALPPKHIRPPLTLMHLAHKHPLLAHPRIRDEHRTPIPPIPGAPPHPPHQIRLIKVIILLAVRVQLPRQTEVRDFALGRGRQPVVVDAALEAVDVAVEDAGIAGVAEEDQRVGVDGEPAGDGGGEGLGGLRVVVHY
jgi:hypothetical protein